MNQWELADRLKLLSHPFLIKLNTVICVHWLLFTVLMWCFVKLPGKFHFLFFFILLFQLHCAFQKSTVWLQGFIIQYRTDSVFLDKEQQSSQGARVARSPSGSIRAEHGSQEQGSWWAGGHWSSLSPSPSISLWAPLWGWGWAKDQARIRPGEENQCPLIQDGLAGPWR